MTDLFAEQARKKFEDIANALWEANVLAHKPCPTCIDALQRALEPFLAAQHPESWYEEKARAIAGAHMQGVFLNEATVLRILKGD